VGTKRKMATKTKAGVQVKKVCPICRHAMPKERHWFFEGVLHHGCNFCYLNFRKEWIKKMNGTQEDDSDDIL
jgi:hypothetical protein